MNKGILCTIDFSDSSREAVRWAVKLAQELSAHLTILYTYRLTHAENGEAVKLKRKMEKEAQEKFAVLEKECLQGSGVSYNFKTEVGFMNDRIEDHAKHNALSFLVMDKKLSQINRETFDELMDNIHVPLVLVP